MKWVETTQQQAFVEKEISPGAEQAPNTVELTGERAQTLRGFGGCFNELGSLALTQIGEDKRHEIFENLFGEGGLNLGFCRIPIGASDYAAEWYSCDETDGDYDMEHFTVKRDEQYLIPYIREALKFHPDIKFFASPWSPPSWMKSPKVYNFGTIRMEPRVLKAYALYLKKFIESYRAEGIDIVQLHVQNEPFADQKFPSCLWKAEELRIFIRDYLGPLFEKEGVKTDIFLGTLNGPEEMSFRPMGGMALENYNKFIDTILFDEKARYYISGIGYQWAGRSAVARTHESFPELELIQTENECGEGKNSWDYAQYVFNLMRRYFHDGVTAYTYWNMVLAPGGKSTWGWNQNAMITADPETGEVTYNPEFYVMKHYAHFIKPGAVLLRTKGHWNSAATAFENPDGSRVLVIQNAMDRTEDMTLCCQGVAFTAALKPNSFNTFIF